MEAKLLCWSRKSALERQDGKPGPITNNTLVRAAIVGNHPGRPTLHQYGWVEHGMVGKVATTGTANRYGAKTSVGTLQAVQVEYSIPDGVMWMPSRTAYGPLRFWVAHQGRWIMDGSRPKDFPTRTEAQAAMDKLKEDK